MSMSHWILRRVTPVVLVGTGAITPVGPAACQVVTPPPPSPKAIQARLDSLENVVLSSDSVLQQREAIRVISSYGEWREPIPSGQVVSHGIVARLARLYAPVEDVWVREHIIELMAVQGEHAQAAAFLEQLAKENDGRATGMGHTLTISAYAINTLSFIVPEGRESLQRLHNSRVITEPMAKQVLDSLAKRGFRPPEHR